MSITTTEQWNEFISKYPEAHLLQTSKWGQLKSYFVWESHCIIEKDAGVQILFRRLPMGFSVAYIPKGPIGSEWQAVLKQSVALCRKKKSIVLYVEPDCWEENFNSDKLSSDFLRSIRSIQPRRTIIISLQGSYDEWLSRMKQKTRYNIRLSQKSGVEIEESKNINVFNHLINITGKRDEFEVHHPNYYKAVYDLFSPNEHCCLLIAKYKDQPLAGLMAFRQGGRAWYFYGASNDVERQRMPAYLLQWEAMKWAARHGCNQYDMWGIPDENEDVLEKNFTKRSDGLWGVYRFKRGFGGEVKRTAGMFEKTINPQMKWLLDSYLKIRRGGFS
jgi:lipid II:glycine glycyltransferase (peptidoglycan interpeptide bridge formation enzyme)